MNKRRVWALVCAACLWAGGTAPALAWGEETFVDREYVWEADAIASLQVEVRDRRIILRPGAAETITLRCRESGKERYALTEEPDGTLHIAMDSRKTWLDYLGMKPDAEHRCMEIFLPADKLRSIRVSTTNGDITVGAVTLAESLTLEVNNGSLYMENAAAGEVILTAKNGNITGELAGNWADYAIDCRIKKGRSNLPTKKEGGSRSLRLSVNHGDIDLNFHPEGPAAP